MTDKQFTEEEKQKILDSISAIGKQFGAGTESLASQIYMDAETTKLIDCRHEILIKVTAHVLEQDMQGTTIGTKEICQKNYHIPVPEYKNHHEYLDGFFNTLENCMQTSAQEADKE
jgi:hypothetical protein